MPAVAIPLAGLTVIATLLGGQIALRLPHTLPTVIALTGGDSRRGGALRRPAGGDRKRRRHQAGRRLWSAVGFLAFFFAERALVLHHRDDPDEARAHERVGVLGALGLSVHSFIDGLGIGLAFGLDATTGFLVFIAVVSHDFADGLNTVSFVLSQSGDRRQATRWLMIDAIAPLLGAIVGSLLTVSEQALGYLLCLYSGFFLYMGATDLLPEAHAHASWQKVGADRVGLRADLRDHPGRRGLSGRPPYLCARASATATGTVAGRVSKAKKRRSKPRPRTAVRTAAISWRLRSTASRQPVVAATKTSPNPIWAAPNWITCRRGSAPGWAATRSRSAPAGFRR